MYIVNVTIAPFLVDGFLAGTWKLIRANKRATLRVVPLEKLKKADARAVEDEAARLLAFVAPDGQIEVRPAGGSASDP
jgi:hypothetical protein